MIGRLRRLPVVERATRRRSSWATPARSPSAPALAGLALTLNTSLLLPDHRRPVRGRDGVGHHPGLQLPGVRPPRVPHGADPPPLRAARAGRRRPSSSASGSSPASPPPSPSASSTPTSRACRRVDRERRRPRSASVVPTRALVVGLGVTGRAVARALVAHGLDGHRRRRSADRGAARRGGRRSASSWSRRPTKAGCGVSWRRPTASSRPPASPSAIRSSPRRRRRASRCAASSTWPPPGTTGPCVAITGTNGKTTVATLVTDMLGPSGRRAVDAGNTEVPLVEAIDDPATEVFVVEASSFRLTFATAFRPTVGTWLNFAPDHLDVHRVARRLRGGEGPTVRAGGRRRAGGRQRRRPGRHAARAGGAAASRRSVSRADADWHVADGRLRGPGGVDLLPVDALPRCAARTTSPTPWPRRRRRAAAGADLDGVRTGLADFAGLPHRVELVGEAGGVRWYDDSKATAPHATLAALAGFDVGRAHRRRPQQGPRPRAARPCQRPHPRRRRHRRGGARGRARRSPAPGRS